MPRKIVKGVDTKGVASFNFKIFSTVDRGVSTFTYKPFEIKKHHDDKDIKNNEEDNNITSEDIPLVSFPQEELEEKLKEEYERGLKDGLERGFISGKEEGIKEGYQKGYYEAEQNLQKEYQVKKEDYLKVLQAEVDLLKNYINKLSSFLDNFDNEMPKIIIRLISDIIGTERKINDQLIVNIVKRALNRLKDLEITDLVVNPRDIEIVQEYFPGYNVVGDGSILQGSLKVKTKIGEVDFTIESMLQDLIKSIYEELGIN